MSNCQTLIVSISEYKDFYGLTGTTDDIKIALFLEASQEYLISYLGYNPLYGVRCITDTKQPTIDDVNIAFTNYGTDTFYKINGVLQPEPTVIGGKIVNCGCTVNGCGVCDIHEICYYGGYQCIPACIITAILQMTNDLMGGSVTTSAGGLTGWTDKVGDLSHSETYDLGGVSSAIFGKLPNAIVECLKRYRKIRIYGLN